MAISFVGSYVGTHAATSAQSIAFSNLKDASGATPTLAQNDIVYVAVENATAAVNRGAGALVPSGYTAAHTALYNTDTNASNFQVSYKVMGSTPDTSVAIPASNATTAGVAYAIYVFRGVNTTTPHSATPTTAGAGNTGVANAPAITPTAGDTGAWIVAFAGAAVAAGAVFTNPAGMSTTTNHFRSATITSTTNDANIGGALYTAWTSGAYDPAVFGGSTSTNTGSWSAVTLALKPYVPPNYQFTLLGGGYSLAGQSATLLKSKLLAGSGGTYALAGQSASLSRNRTLTASAGIYALAGQSVAISKGRTLTALGGAYSYAGQQTTITYVPVIVGYTLTAQGGGYSLTGQSATINRDRSLTASGGSYTLAGQSADILRSRILTSQGGAYSLTGRNAIISYAPIGGVAGIAYWTGAGWVEKPVKYWDGNAWVTKPVKHWNGGTWV